MISANELRNVQISKYSNEELTYIIQQASDTIEAYEKENKEIYKKMEFLARKIEEYREEEDSIKAALITAEKSAEHTRKESQQKAQTLIEESENTANKTLDDAQKQADKIIAEAREYATSLVNQKTKEAENIVTEAEKKSNEAINSAKVVAQDVLDQAKEISTDLLAKSKEEKLAYSLLIKNIKSDAQEFVSNLKELYSQQLEALEGANFETSSEDDEDVEDIQSDVDALIKEIDEMKESFPRSIYLEDLEEQTKELEEKQETVEEEIEETVNETVEEAQETVEEAKEPEQDPIDEIEDEVQDDEETLDAINAFSSNNYVPYEKTNSYISEIDEEPEMEDVYSNPQDDEEKSLFDEENSISFEDFFNVKREDADDRTETISLVSPEEEEEDEEPKFKGFFGRKKK